MESSGGEKLRSQLISKSIEAFIMGLEIFNKPTLKYRVEGFAFFICNAWELLLKSEIIKKFGEKVIYYKDNNERTIGISDALRKIFSNENDPLRKNLEKVIELRNTSTHFITEEYGIIYAPIFQACVLNFRNKMLEFANIDVAASIPENFLTLSVNIGDFTNESVMAKYAPELARKLITRRNDLALLEQNENNPKFSISIRQDLYITKKKNSADLTVAISNGSDSKIRIVKELRDPSNTHNYSFGNIIDAVNKTLISEGIPFCCVVKSTGNKRTKFNKADLSLFNSFYDVKNNKDFCYAHKTNGRITMYSYSPRLVDFIVEQIKKDPAGIIDKIKDALNENQ